MHLEEALLILQVGFSKLLYWEAFKSRVICIKRKKQGQFEFLLMLAKGGFVCGKGMWLPLNFNVAYLNIISFLVTGSR
jgi:hypothetical protein